MDINLQNTFLAYSKESNTISFDYENQLKKESPDKFKRKEKFPDSIDKEKNIFNPLENKIYDKNLLFQKEEVVSKVVNGKLENENENEKENMSNEEIVNIKENKKSKEEIYDKKSTKIKHVIPCDKGENIINVGEKIGRDNMINITNEENESYNNFKISSGIFSKNNNININNDFLLFTSSKEESNIIPLTKEIIKNKKKILFEDLFSNNKESENLDKKEFSKKEFIEFEIIYKLKEKNRFEANLLFEIENVEYDILDEKPLEFEEFGIENEEFYFDKKSLKYEGFEVENKEFYNDNKSFSCGEFEIKNKKFYIGKKSFDYEEFEVKENIYKKLIFNEYKNSMFKDKKFNRNKESNEEEEFVSEKSYDYLLGPFEIKKIKKLKLLYFQNFPKKLFIKFKKI